MLTLRGTLLCLYLREWIKVRKRLKQVSWKYSASSVVSNITLYIYVYINLTSKIYPSRSYTIFEVTMSNSLQAIYDSWKIISFRGSSRCTISWTMRILCLCDFFKSREMLGCSISSGYNFFSNEQGNVSYNSCCINYMDCKHICVVVWALFRYILVMVYWKELV